MTTAVALDPDVTLPLNTGPDKYLELLKRALTDLLVPSMRTYMPQLDIPPEVVQALAESPDLRERVAYHIRLRGLDWPDSAVTMVGYDGLTHLQQCIQTILDEDIPGDLIETGIWRGGACIFMREALGDDPRRVWAADSFQGFDAADPDGAFFGTADYLKVSVDQVRRNFQRFGVATDGVVFLQGWFRDTLPTLHDKRWSLIRLDGDTHQATRLALDHLYPNLSPGGFCVIDDYGAVDGCKQAVDEHLGPAASLLHLDAGRAYWRKPA